MSDYSINLCGEAVVNNEKTGRNTPTSTLIADIRSGFVNASRAIGKIDKMVLAYYDSDSGTTTSQCKED